MHARVARESVVALLDELRPVVACVTERPIFASRIGAAIDWFSVAFRPIDRPAPVALPSGAHLLFSVNLQFELTDPSNGNPRPRIAAYRYHILDRDEREILAFHWHPQGASPMRSPHLHLSSAIGPVPLPNGGAVALDRMHLSTGIVSLGDIIRLLFTELDATPRRGDWAAVLDRLEQRGVVDPQTA